jgi:hypothetical protein
MAMEIIYNIAPKAINMLSHMDTKLNNGTNYSDAEIKFITPVSYIIRDRKYHSASQIIITVQMIHCAKFVIIS